ncbi:hypothetical protein RDWZM_001267 [Blomia tropicalis]|uniref:Uncharacterized protein n=1 Tax=Blomia tropicalis TaxID=40697 RepID=A0A9Q0MEB2_BLOTA|nr:hypothetical protein RDWZM_001267 [Blomia tropicalis]
MVNISLANAASAVAKDVEDVIEGVESKVESAQDAVADTLNLDGKINPIIQAQTSLFFTIFIRNPEEGKEEEGGQHTPVTGSAPNP